MSDSNPALKSLYPFLHGEGKKTAAEEQALLESVRRKAQESVSVKQQFFAQYDRQLLAMAQAITAVYLQGGRLFTMGNGGSACDAAHFAVEFLHPVTAGRPGLPAVNLCTDMAMVSAVGNDVGIEQIFARQLEALASPKDGLVGFSTSGNSANLMAAYAQAQRMGLTTLGFAGGEGGQMYSSGLLSHCLVVPTDSIHRVQEVHLCCYHILWDLVHTLLADQRGGLATAAEASP